MQDAELWNIALPEKLAGPTEEGIWKEHLPALQAFIAGQTQWRISQGRDGKMRFVGLDYTALEVAMRGQKNELSPKGWADLQMIELAAMAALNGG